MLVLVLDRLISLHGFNLHVFQCIVLSFKELIYYLLFVPFMFTADGIFSPHFLKSTILTKSLRIKEETAVYSITTTVWEIGMALKPNNPKVERTMPKSISADNRNSSVLLGAECQK